MFWQFFSFDRSRWSALFNGSIPDAKKHFASSAWQSTDPRLPDFEEDPRGFLDFIWQHAPRNVIQVADHVSRNGLSYRELNGEQARILDSMISGFFCPEGLEHLLAFTQEHQVGMSDRAMRELLSRAEPTKVGGFLGIGGRISVGQPVQLSPWLATGRRYGMSEAPSSDDRYFVFDEVEVPDVLQEVVHLLAVDRPWRTAEFESVVQVELLPALERAAAKGRFLAGRFT